MSFGLSLLLLSYISIADAVDVRRGSAGGLFRHCDDAGTKRFQNGQDGENPKHIYPD